MLKKTKLKKYIYLTLLITFGMIVNLKAFAFEEETTVFANAELVKENSLQEVRGGYMGVYFQVIFTGFWDNLGHNISILEGDSNSNFSTEQAATSSSETNVRSIALIGGFNGANGIFQINQVPGSNNIIENNLVININIITDQQITQSLSEMIRNVPLNF
jgi:hypothetical protein